MTIRTQKGTDTIALGGLVTPGMGTLSVVSAPGGATATFPSSIANLVFRVRGDLGVTLGTGVSAWADQSGGGNNVVQATGANQPTYTLTMNGHNVLSFSGSQYLTMASRLVLSAVNGYTYGVVFRTTSTATVPAGYVGDLPITAIGDSTANVENQLGVGSGKGSYDVFNATWHFISGTTSVNNGTAHAVFVTDTGTAQTLYTDGNSEASGATTVVGNPGLDSIGRGFNTADSWVGDIAEAFVYSRPLNGTELGQLYAYIKGFWGTP